MSSASAKVSTFELLVKPIAPGFVTFARTAIDGYFLTLSNLGHTAKLAFLAVIPKWDPATGNPAEGYQNRELTISGPPAGPPPPFDPSGVANHQAIYDITGGLPGPPTFGQTDAGELQYLGETACTRIYVSKTYGLCAGQTAGFRLLPNLGNLPGLLASKRFEVRGFLSVGVYGLEINSNTTSRPTTQFLLTPEQRGTFIPNSVTSAGSPVNLSDLDQIDTSLTPAEGAIVTLTTPTGISANVKDWANSNGIDASIVEPFDHVLAPIV